MNKGHECLSINNWGARGAHRSVSWTTTLTTTLLVIALVGTVIGQPAAAQIFRSTSASTEPTPTFKQRSSRFLDLFKTKNVTPPTVYQQPPSLQMLVADLNAKSTRIKQLSNDVVIAIPGSPKIRGTLQVEFPNRMRLKAGVMNISEMGVDAGSNNEAFWVWSKVALPPANSPALYYAKHAEFQNSRMKQQLPLEPRWLIDAFGIVKLNPQGKHELKGLDSSGRLVLQSARFEANGSQSTRRMLINLKSGLVEQMAVYDPKGNLVAWANAQDFRYDEKHRISLPHRVTLSIVQPGKPPLQVRVDLVSSYSINSLFGDPALMWAMPTPDDVQVFNLGR